MEIKICSKHKRPVISWLHNRCDVNCGGKYYTIFPDLIWYARQFVYWIMCKVHGHVCIGNNGVLCYRRKVPYDISRDKSKRNYT